MLHRPNITYGRYVMIFKSKPANTPAGALARLWRNIIENNNLKHGLGYLVTKYIAKHAGGSKNISRKTRSTLEADITANEMTWKKFNHLIFNYLGAIRLDVTIKLHFSNGVTSVHTVAITSSDNENNNDIDEVLKKGDNDK